MTTPKTEDIPGADIKGSVPFPGYNEAVGYIAKLGAYLKLQGDLWNQAWSQVVGGNFDHKAWLALAARSADANFQYLRDFLTMGREPSANAPTWLALTLDLKKGGPVIQTSPVIPGLLTEPTATDFSPLGAGQGQEGFAPEVSKLNDGRIRVSVTKPKAPKATLSGRYISLVFAKGVQTSPMLIVLLEVTP